MSTADSGSLSRKPMSCHFSIHLVALSCVRGDASLITLEAFFVLSTATIGILNAPNPFTLPSIDTGISNTIPRIIERRRTAGFIFLSSFVRVVGMLASSLANHSDREIVTSESLVAMASMMSAPETELGWAMCARGRVVPRRSMMAAAAMSAGIHVRTCQKKRSSAQPSTNEQQKHRC